MNKFLYTLYGLVAIVHLYLAYHHLEYPGLEDYSKLALMPILLLVVLRVYFKDSKRYFLLIAAGLILSLVGDYFLTKTDELSFLLGLGSFLPAHILYGLAFVLAKEDSFEVQIIYKAPVYIIVLVMSTVFTFVHLKPGMGDMVMPVVFYMIAILFMASMALSRYGFTTQRSFWFAMAGALLYMISDGIIAFDKFKYVINRSEFWVMLTYVLAQFLIVVGVLRHSDFSKTTSDTRKK